jgi:hypothetical protein
VAKRVAKKAKTGGTGKGERGFEARLPPPKPKGEELLPFSPHPGMVPIMISREDLDGVTTFAGVISTSNGHATVQAAEANRGVDVERVGGSGPHELPMRRTTSATYRPAWRR